MSEEMTSAASRQSSPSSWSEVWGAAIARPAVAIRSAIARSLSPPQTTTTRRPSLSCRLAATAAKRSSGQSFDGHPAPGLRITGAVPGPRAATHASIRARASGQRGISNWGSPARMPSGARRAQFRSTTCAADGVTGRFVTTQEPSRASGRAWPMRIGLPARSVTRALFRSPCRSIVTSGLKARRSRRRRRISDGRFVQPRGRRKTRSIARCPSRTSAERPSTAQPTVAVGKASLIATATGTPWRTSPMAESFTKRIVCGAFITGNSLGIAQISQESGSRGKAFFPPLPRRFTPAARDGPARRSWPKPPAAGSSRRGTASTRAHPAQRDGRQ